MGVESSSMNSSFGLLSFLCSLITVTGQLEGSFGIVSGSIVEEGVNLNGRHLNVCVSYIPGIFEAVKDEGGKIVSFQGTTVTLLEWFAQQANFTFEYVFDIPGGRVPYSLLPFDVKCDLFTRGSLQEPSDRFDFLQPYMFTELAMLIPMPELIPMNVDAVWKPFQSYVWLALLVAAIPLGSFGLAYVDYKESTASANTKFKTLFATYLMYTIKTLMLQQGGNFFPVVKGKLRIALSAWLLAAFVLVTAYSSVLISSILAPNFKQLIGNAKELSVRDDVYPVVIKGNGPDIYFNISSDSMLKKLALKLNSLPVNRVPNITFCFNKVKDGNGNVCIDTFNQLTLETRRDFIRTGQCPLHAKSDNSLGNWYFGWMVNKNSTLKEPLNQGILKEIENGLVPLWHKLAFTGFKRPHCFDVAESILSGGLDSKFSKLNLRNLIGPFIILLSGYAIAIWVFVFERVIHLIVNIRQKQQIIEF